MVEEYFDGIAKGALTSYIEVDDLHRVSKEGSIGLMHLWSRWQMVAIEGRLRWAGFVASAACNGRRL